MGPVALIFCLVIEGDLAEQGLNIGFLGGTFDPVHLGHLIKAQDVLEALGLDRVYFVPTSANPFKADPPVAGPSERRAMLELAIDGDKRFGVLELELELESEGPSFTIDTVRELVGQFQGQGLFWIIGTDQLPGLARWREIEELVTLVEFACVRRPGWAFEEPGIPGLRLHQVEGHVCEISSTEIRERAEKGRHFSLFLPKKVYKFICSRNLFK